MGQAVVEVRLLIAEAKAGVVASLHPLWSAI